LEVRLISVDLPNLLKPPSDPSLHSASARARQIGIGFAYLASRVWTRRDIVRKNRLAIASAFGTVRVG
jgi:putative flippase GtrA